MACLGLASSLVQADIPLLEPERNNQTSFAYLFVDNPNGKFGEYNGLDEGEHYIALGLDWFLRDKEIPASYWNVSVYNLGLETSYVRIEQGKQGNYRLRAGFEQLQKIWHDDALTIYDDALEELPDPRVITTGSKRNAWNVGFDKYFGSQWELKTDYRSEDKTGQRSKPLNGGLIVPQDLNFMHNEFNASLSYATHKAQLAFSTYASDFKNGNDQVLDTAAMPNNRFNQLAVNGGLSLAKAGRFTGFFAWSRGRQNDPFTRYGIDDGTYETNSLNGKYETRQLRLGYRKRISGDLDLDAGYWLDDRDNDTPLYNGFPSDKNNKVYKWKKQKLFVKARYRLPARWKLIGGLQFDDRHYQTHKVPRDTGRLPEQSPLLQDNTDETTLWLELRSAFYAGLFGSLKLSHSDRNSDLDSVHQTAISEDTTGVTLSYYLIPRDRNQADLNLSWAVNEQFSLGFLHTVVNDDFESISWAGIKQQNWSTTTFDLGWVSQPGHSVGIYAGAEYYEVSQYGQGSLGEETSNWAYDISDEGIFAGATAHYTSFNGQVDFHADYRYYLGEGYYETLDPANVSGSFPELKTRIQSLTLRADVKLSPKWHLDIRYHYEDYSSHRWVWKDAFDVLNYGYETPNYKTHVLMVTGDYRF